MSAAESIPKQRIIWPLLALNFFMADMQAGIGPFLGVFLLARHWHAGLIGTVMTLGGIAGMVMTAPMGALVDGSRHKRLLVIIPGIATLLASSLILVSQNFWVIAASQIASAVAGAAIGPAVIGITLGIVRQSGFMRQNGRNQAFNHAGNMVGAALSGYLGWVFGFPAVLALAALFGLLSIISVLLIPARAIDDRAARGLKGAAGSGEKAGGLRVLAQSRPLLLLAAALGMFHLGNGAMLPLYGMAVVASQGGSGPLFVAETIVIAQGVMILAAIAAAKGAERTSYWAVLLVSFAALPIRGLIASHAITHLGVYPVQMLDGVGAGLQSVAVPGLVARVLNGTGRVNLGQGAVMTVQGVGAALSPAIGGWIAQEFGYAETFRILGCFALGSIALWLIFGRIVREGERLQAEGNPDPPTAAPPAGRAAPDPRAGR